MSTPHVLQIHIDGAARGNPGPAAFAYVISRDGAPPVEQAGLLGETTNNVAEYTALVRALEHAAALGATQVVVRSDSELLVKQMNGEYKVKHPSLRELYEEAQELAAQFDSVTIVHVRREQNKRADQLCNEALDAATKKTPAAAKPRRKKPAPDAARAAMLEVLREAAAAWARGDPADPDPALVCDHLWDLLDDLGAIKPGAGA